MKHLMSIICIVSPVLLFAQGFQVNLQGQKQQAMGGAGAGTNLDAAAVFFNPGGISHLEQNSVSAGVSLTAESTTFQDNNSQQQYHTKSPVSAPFTAYGVWGPAESKFKFGMGIYTPFGSTIKYEDGWSGRFALTQMKLMSVFFQPTVSYKINDKLGVGAGFVYGYGNIDLSKDLPITNSNGDYASANLKGTAGGMGYNLGILYKPVERLSIGLSYRSQVNMKVNKGTATFNVPPSLASSFPSGSFSSSLPLPQVITLGFGYSVSERLLLAFDVNYIGWSSYKTLSFDYEQNTSSLKDTESPRNYKDSYALRLGAQYKVSDKFMARLGTNYEKSPIKDGYVTPEVPDADRLNFTGGIGYKPCEKLVIDASFSYINFMKRTDTNTETNLSGTYKTRILVPGISLTYNFN
ncbi:MAG: OmpP1/FadL family transporter [Cytophaga sp.]|uniref:OmpP1/FadL family transporter n=1 Tax=Cytophaga sp. TaxID=29535 RepID=UPI003F7DECC3